MATPRKTKKTKKPPEQIPALTYAQLEQIWFLVDQCCISSFEFGSACACSGFHYEHLIPAPEFETRYGKCPYQGRMSSHSGVFTVWTWFDACQNNSKALLKHLKSLKVEPAKLEKLITRKASSQNILGVLDRLKKNLTPPNTKEQSLDSNEKNRTTGRHHTIVAKDPGVPVNASVHGVQSESGSPSNPSP